MVQMSPAEDEPEVGLSVGTITGAAEVGLSVGAGPSDPPHEHCLLASQDEPCEKPFAPLRGAILLDRRLS